MKMIGCRWFSNAHPLGGVPCDFAMVVKTAIIALSVSLLLFYIFMPDLAAAQTGLFKADHQTELRVAFSADIARPDRYKLDISRRNISLGSMTGWGQRPVYLTRLYYSDGKLDSAKIEHADSMPTYISPTVAFFIGFGPGFFIHGLGHAYIGKGNTTLVLMGIEAVSVGLFLAMAISTWDDPHAPDLDLLAFSCVIIFLGSWIYDFAAAPAKAISMNQQAELERKNRAAISIDAGIKDNQARLVISLRW